MSLFSNDELKNCTSIMFSDILTLPVTTTSTERYQKTKNSKILQRNTNSISNWTQRRWKNGCYGSD